MNGTEKKHNLLPIGTVAKSFGISDNCIRRMEAAGLLKPAYISPESGYRYYDAANVSRIGSILTLRSFGFVNEDIKAHLNSSRDYSVLYDKLLKRQDALNQLVDRMSRLIKNNGFYHCEITGYSSSYCYTKKVRIVPSLATLSNLTCEMLYGAIKSGLPVNYNRAVLLKTDCMDYRDFRTDIAQDLTICLPLRERVEGPEIDLIPAEKVVSVSWSFPGPGYREIIRLIDELFIAKGLTQTDTLRASYDTGGHMANESSSEDAIMHLFVPIG